MKISVTNKERFYFLLSALVSVSVYSALVLMIIALFTKASHVGAVPLMYIFSFFAFIFISHGLFIGFLRANAVLISDKQFPLVDKIVKHSAEQLGLRKVPPVYLMQQGGILNAFATKFLGRHYVILLAEVVELALEQGEAELSFIIAHELGHVKRNHMGHHLFLLPSRLVPFLGKAYSRACEYTCDGIAAQLYPKGAATGLLCLAAGKKLFRHLSVKEYLEQHTMTGGFWVWFAEVVSTHPHLPNRINALPTAAVYQTQQVHSFDSLVGAFRGQVSI